MQPSTLHRPGTKRHLDAEWDSNRLSLWDVITRLHPDWHRRGLCRAHPQVDWFPTKSEDMQEPIRICRRCPVQSECLDYALSRPILYGIWGGKSARERARMQRYRVDGEV